MTGSIAASQPQAKLEKPSWITWTLTWVCLLIRASGLCLWKGKTYQHAYVSVWRQSDVHANITLMSYGPHYISLKFFSNSLFKFPPKKTPKIRITGPFGFERNSLVTGGLPQNGTVNSKALLCHDIIMVREREQKNGGFGENKKGRRRKTGEGKQQRERTKITVLTYTMVWATVSI